MVVCLHLWAYGTSGEVSRLNLSRAPREKLVSQTVTIVHSYLVLGAVVIFPSKEGK